jgi:hypothetical protein
VREGTAGLANGLFDDIGIREVEEERHQIREAFVERGDVDVGRVEKRRPQPVEQRMRRLVDDDVVAEGGADQAALERETGRLVAGAEIAERQVAGLSAVAGVAAVEPERPHDEPQRAIGRRRCRPRDVPAERTSEGAIREAADGVHHLHVEASVGGRRRQAARQEKMRIVEVERLGLKLGRRALAVHGEERADGPWLELLVGHLYGRDAAEAIRHRRIQCVNAKRPDQRGSRIALIRPHSSLESYAVAHLVRLHHA